MQGGDKNTIYSVFSFLCARWFGSFAVCHRAACVVGANRKCAKQVFPKEIFKNAKGGFFLFLSFVCCQLLAMLSTRQSLLPK
jgi:hypothetical protein